MRLKIIDGELIQTPTVSNYTERRIASLGRRLVKKMGGHIDSNGNYGSNNTKHYDLDGSVSIIETPRHINNNN